MTARRKQWIGVVLAIAVLAAGCGVAEKHPRAAIGAGVGAVGGAIVGGLAEGSDGALVGAVVGALAGGVIGALLDRKDKSAEETYEEYAYDPAEGTRIEVVNVGAYPDSVNPGDEVKLEVTYALMAADPSQELEVTETRLVTKDGARVAETTAEVSRTPGTYTSDVNVTLPGAAGTGTYQLLVTVGAAGKWSSSAATFAVN
ncbi:MAG: glycine zipper domain-containing protein [Planctomycetota bacterium]|jgi:outer membrane lipoprotein SlyB